MRSIGLDPDALKTVAIRVYDRLKIAIASGEISSGERISERTIAQQMGVSTSPVKRALHRLHMEGLVDIKPRKGTYVTDFSLTYLSDIAEIRAALEGLAARFAARYATEKEKNALNSQILVLKELTNKKDLKGLAEAGALFHQMIRNLSKNPFIPRIVETLHFYREIREINGISASSIRIRRRGSDLKQGFREHKAVFEAIAKGDGDLAEKRMKEHIIRPFNSAVSKSEKVPHDDAEWA